MRDPETLEEQQIAEILPQPGLAFRGSFDTVGRDSYEVGRSYRHHGLLRCSRDVRVATDNFADPDIVAVFGREGRDIDLQSEHPEEAETVHWPDPVLTVIAQRRLESRVDARLGDSLGDKAAHRGSDQRHEPGLAEEPFVTVVLVHGEENDEMPDPEDAIQRVARAIAAAHELPPAEISRPGRFRGPIGVDASGSLAPHD